MAINEICKDCEIKDKCNFKLDNGKTLISCEINVDKNIIKEIIPDLDTCKLKSFTIRVQGHKEKCNSGT